ncbi:Pol Polyprotein [Phytophthora cinnamomi]|uniref:Pol Polyprotein n=1 Tax=Phytophthora cinnamomi TaxID=4785 RepID=UPI00355A96E1|nr:Pol Polyprotein [Phytophthora cinnamomi]
MGISPAMQQQQQQLVSAQPQPVPFQHAPVPDQRQQQQFVPSQGFVLKIPSFKLPIERFCATQVISGGDWPADFKDRALNRHLEGPARKYFDRRKTIWSAESPTLEQLTNRMFEVYKKEVTVEQVTRMMRARKRVDRTWIEQCYDLFAIASAADCSERLVLQYICECAPLEIQRAM